MINQEEEEYNADIVISGRIFDKNGQARNGALAIKDGCYLAIGSCDEISHYIGLNTIMCGYRNKSVLAGLYSVASGENVIEMGSHYRADGNFQIMIDPKPGMRVGSPANLIVYDEEMDYFSEESVKNAGILLKIVDGKITYQRKTKQKKHPFIF